MKYIEGKRDTNIENGVSESYRDETKKRKLKKEKRNEIR